MAVPRLLEFAVPGAGASPRPHTWHASHPHDPQTELLDPHGAAPGHGVQLGSVAWKLGPTRRQLQHLPHHSQAQHLTILGFADGMKQHLDTSV